jgi:hypothetical protein
MDGWVHIMPARGEIASVAAELLALARTPLDVRTDGNGNEFVVPPYLAELYNAPAAAPKRRRTKKDEEGE